jgi:hypothetical protein
MRGLFQATKVKRKCNSLGVLLKKALFTGRMRSEVVTAGVLSSVFGEDDPPD